MYVSKFFGFKLFLDLEDGYYESIKKETSIKKFYAQIVTHEFNRLCKDGTLLACRNLKRFIHTNNNLVYYGKINNIETRLKFTGDKIKILMSGTLCEETGLNLLLDAVKFMRVNKLEWASKFEFHVTGNSSEKNDLVALHNEKSSPSLHFHGRLSHEKYKSILRSCDVGLSLKPIGGLQAQTTFPSKILEYGEAGLLVISTDISDVKMLVGEGSVILQENNVACLVDQFKIIANNQNEYRKVAIRGQNILFGACSEDIVSIDLIKFLFKRSTAKNG
jgi:glycosyltransferase involved in cell wall biosynthesis